MSEQIDWSKAPEGASHYVIGWGFFKLDLAGWFICDDGEKVWRKTPYQSPDNFSWWGNAVERPSPSWIGEGLPPVGVVCEVVDGGSIVYGHGESGPVVAHVEDCAVVRMSYGLGCFTASYLRPIRTPEQIAADERERFAEELTRAMAMDGRPRSMEQARRMYDLGYRKL